MNTFTTRHLLQRNGTSEFTIPKITLAEKESREWVLGEDPQLQKTEREQKALLKSIGKAITKLGFS